MISILIPRLSGKFSHTVAQISDAASRLRAVGAERFRLVYKSAHPMTEDQVKQVGLMLVKFNGMRNVELTGSKDRDQWSCLIVADWPEDASGVR